MRNYKYLHLEQIEKVLWVRMGRGDFNDMDMDFLDELIEVHHHISKSEDVRVVILASQNKKYFCNGLDPKYMLSLDIDGRAGTFAKLLELGELMYSLNKIEISLIQGHCMAGGAIIALMADFRLLSEGRFRFSFSETGIGLFIPGPVLNILESVVSKKELTRAALLAYPYTPKEAHLVGLADELLAPEDYKRKLNIFIKKILDLPQKSLLRMKEELRRENLRAFENFRKDPSGMEEFKNYLRGDFEIALRAIVERKRPVF